MLQEKLASTRAFIAAHLAAMKNPCVACSFGKDSMVVLALVREQMPKIPVVYFDAFPSPTKHHFAERIEREWGLDVYCPKPAYRDVIAKDDQVELIELHFFAPQKAAYFPIEAEPGYIPDEHCHCAVDRLSQRTEECQLAFDGVFIGHRNDDVDPTYGAVPLVEDAVVSDTFRYLYPIKDWTEADIWQATNLLEIPQNWARYSQNEMAANNDYYPLCTRCLASDVPVICPKSGQLIPGVRQAMQADQKRQEWRDTFINLA